MWCLLFRRQHFQAAFVIDLKSNSPSSGPILITAACIVSQFCQVQILLRVCNEPIGCLLLGFSPCYALDVPFVL